MKKHLRGTIQHKMRKIEMNERRMYQLTKQPDAPAFERNRSKYMPLVEDRKHYVDNLIKTFPII